MKKSWKIFTIVISSLLAVMIVCLTINLSIDKVTSNVLPIIKDNNNTVQNGDNNQYNGGQNNNVNVNPQGNGGNTQVQTPDTPNGGNANQQTPNQQTPNQQGGTQTPVQNTANPLNYSKSQLIAYYNGCLKKSYAQPKVNATKTEHVDVSVSGIDIGNLNMDVDEFAQNIIANNTKKNDQLQQKSFSNGKAGDGTSITQFVLPANLYDGAVKSISASPNGNGYKIVIVLNPESCSHTGVAKYNASCAWPLDINVIDFGAVVKINSCTFNYPGTTLTATIDSQGRVTNTVVEMPLTVANAQAKALGVNITVGSISGKWTCKNTMSF